MNVIGSERRGSERRESRRSGAHKLAAALKLGLMASVCATAGTVVTAGPALGQETIGGTLDFNRGLDILNRPRPEYDARGIPFGSFTLYPRLTLGAGYDDNIFANDDEVEEVISDGFAFLVPVVALQSNWSRHDLRAEAYSRHELFFENGDEDQTDWGIRTNGRIDVRRDTNIALGGSYEEFTEDRSSLDSPAATARPIDFIRATATASINHRFNRLTASVGGGYVLLDFDDAEATGGGIIDQDFRDRQIFQVLGRLGYDFSPGYRWFVAGGYNWHDYDNAPPLTDFNRDNEGYDVTTGIEFQVTRLLQGEVFVGYLEQNYDDPAFSDIEGVTYGADVLWSPTPLTSLKLSGARVVDDATTPGVGGRLLSTVGLTAEHELLRNVILKGEIEYAKIEFEGDPREDDQYQAGGGFTYLLNRNIDIDFQYLYLLRDSNLIAQDFERSIFLISTTLKL